MATLLPNDDVSRTALRGYRIFIYSHDHPHPPHVHFGKRRRVSAWDLTTRTCRDEDGFSSREIAEQRTLLETYADAIWNSWNAHWQGRQGDAGEPDQPRR